MKSVLLIVPFENIYPPVNGGLQRFFHIIHQLSKHSDLTVITKQKNNEFLEAKDEYPTLAKIRVLSTAHEPKPKDVFSVLPEKLQKALRYRWYKKSIKGPADGNFLAYYSVLKRCLMQQRFDAIILESPATLNAVTLIRKFDQKVRIIFDAHNVNTNLDASFLERKEISKSRYLQTRKSESNLYRTVDAVLTCSRRDSDDFDRLNKGRVNVSVIPNGVKVCPRLHDTEVRSNRPRCLLFCGFLSSKPNSEGLFWFYQSIWGTLKKEFPHLKLIVLGSGTLPPKMDIMRKDEDLFFTGRVDGIKSWYEKCAVSIVPLKTGSGTRLKILEAMSYGVPVVSTSKGAEGLEYKDGFDIVIADGEEEFAENIIRLIKDKEKRLFLQKNARHLVESKYDWDIIGEQLNEFLINE